MSLDCIESGPIFPGHLNHPIHVGKRKRICGWTMSSRWQNFRSSAATDLARSVPSHIAASICGHTEEVAKEHYWKVGQGDLDQTMEKLSKIHSEKLAIKVAIKDDSQGLESSHSVSTTCDDETKKPKESLGFVAICRLLSEAGLLSRMGEEGLEPPTSTL